MKNTLVLIDRDGVLIYDKKYHLGRQKDWKKKVKILPYVIQGLKLLKKLPVHAYIITNQPGVAVMDFPLLTLKKAHEVNRYIINKIKREKGYMEGYFLCPHASKEYARKRDYRFNNKMVCNCACIKPDLGMVFDALKKEGFTKRNTDIYVVGDRASDIQTALNAGGIGILVPFRNEPGQRAKVLKIMKRYRNRIHTAKNFLEAAKFIEKTLKKDKLSKGQYGQKR